MKFACSNIMNQSPPAAAENIDAIVATARQEGACTIPVPGVQELLPSLFRYLNHMPEVVGAEPTTGIAQKEAFSSSGVGALVGSDPTTWIAQKKAFSSSGFGALNEPSSFHNKPARDLRRCVYTAVTPVMKAWLKAEGLSTSAYNYEQLIDRLLVRQPDQQPMLESAHRDESTNARPGDVIFGGWLALSDGDGFTFSPKSHRNEDGDLLAAGGKGFAKLGKGDAKQYVMKKIAVPKFSVILFHAHIVHKVAGSKRKVPLIRLFVGHRLTTHAEPLFNNASPILRKGLSRPPALTSTAGDAAGTVATGATTAGGAASSADGTKARRGLKRKRGEKQAAAVVEGMESPSLSAVFKKFRGPPLPSGQQFPIISAFAYAMHKAKKYAWMANRYKPGLFGLVSWPPKPLPWSKIGFMNPDAASALLEGDPNVPLYTETEKAIHRPHPL